MTKDAIVILKSADSYNNVGLSLFDGKLYKGDYASTAMPQHLYIYSPTDKINEGDWIIRAFDYAILRDNVNSDNRKGEKFYKIIATTDTLVLSYGPPFKVHTVPFIPKSFVDKFIKQYNRGNEIEIVQIEYDLVEDKDDLISLGSDGSGSNFYGNKEILKINADNLINIAESKETLQDILARIDETIEMPFVTARFGNQWKEHAKAYPTETLINIAWRHGRRAILLERELENLLNNE